MGINLLFYWEHLTGGNGLMLHFNSVAPAFADIKDRKFAIQHPVQMSCTVFTTIIRFLFFAPGAMRSWTF